MEKYDINYLTKNKWSKKNIFFNLLCYVGIAIFHAVALNLYMNFSIVIYSFTSAIFIFFVLNKFKQDSFFSYKAVFSFIVFFYAINLLLTYYIVNKNINSINQTDSIDVKSLFLLKPVLQVTFLTEDGVIQSIHNKKFLDQQIIAKIKNTDLILNIKGSHYRDQTIREILMSIFLSLLFFIFFIFHHRNVNASSISRKSTNYVVIGIIMTVSEFALLTIATNLHIDSSKLSQKVLEDHFYGSLYINENNKNLYTITKGEKNEL